MAWTSRHESGHEFQTQGANRRLPVEFDGLHLMAFHPPEKARSLAGKKPVDFWHLVFFPLGTIGYAKCVPRGCGDEP
ncbi:hypothetical protein ACFS3C_08380 [Azotobacter vinelandii]